MFQIGKALVETVSRKYELNRLNTYRWMILIVTFFTYLSYHLARRSLSVVKPVLNRKNCSDLPADEIPVNVTDPYWCDWDPFKGEHAKSLLGSLDTTFLVTYAITMYINGALAERYNLRYYLTVSMICAGMFNVLFGLASFFNIHSLWYFYMAQFFTGCAQSAGWPSVLGIVGNWFGPGRRGLIFGIWNSHINFGNMAGAAVGGAVLDINWGLSFIVPGCIIATVGVLVFLFVVQRPSEVGLTVITVTPEEEESLDNISEKSNNISEKSLKESSKDEKQSQQQEEHRLLPISLREAFRIKGVIEFSLCLFFAKLVSYTFLDWLPLYIAETTHGSSRNSAYLSMSFDVGGAFGAIFAGYLSDKTGASGFTCVFNLILAFPALVLFYFFGKKSLLLNEILQFIAGFFVDAPYALITTAVSAELGTKVPSKAALATISGIIDATGSIGGAVGPSIAGVVQEYGWDYVFIMMMCANLCAILTVARVGYKESRKLWHRYKKWRKN